MTEKSAAKLEVFILLIAGQHVARPPWNSRMQGICLFLWTSLRKACEKHLLPLMVNTCSCLSLQKRCTDCCNFFSRNMADEFNPMHCNCVCMLVIGDHPLTTMIVGFRIWLMVMYVQSFPHCKSFILGLLDLISNCHAMCVVHITPCLLILFCHNYQILKPFWVISPETHLGICSSLIKVEDRRELYTTAHLFVNLLLWP